MLIIIHGNIKTMEGRDYEDGFLQIKDGKIAAVGRMEDCDPALLRDRKRVQVIDAGGNLVMPGIIEAHCHMGITEEKKGMEGSCKDYMLQYEGMPGPGIGSGWVGEQGKVRVSGGPTPPRG